MQKTEVMFHQYKVQNTPESAEIARPAPETAEKQYSRKK